MDHRPDHVSHLNTLHFQHDRVRVERGVKRKKTRNEIVQTFQAFPTLISLCPPLTFLEFPYTRIPWKSLLGSQNPMHQKKKKNPQLSTPFSITWKLEIGPTILRFKSFTYLESVNYGRNRIAPCGKANMPYNNIVWILSIHGLMLSQKIDGEKRGIVFVG